MSFSQKEDKNSPFTPEMLEKIGERIKLEKPDELRKIYGGLSLIPPGVMHELKNEDSKRLAAQTMRDKAEELVNLSLDEFPKELREAIKPEESNHFGSDANFETHMIEHSPYLAMMVYIQSAIYSKFGMKEQIPSGQTLQNVRDQLDGKLQHAGLHSKDVDTFLDLIDSSIDFTAITRAGQSEQKKMWF